MDQKEQKNGLPIERFCHTCGDETEQLCNRYLKPNADEWTVEYTCTICRRTI